MLVAVVVLSGAVRLVGCLWLSVSLSLSFPRQVFSATLNRTDLASGKNSFYILQLIETEPTGGRAPKYERLYNPPPPSPRDEPPAAARTAQVARTNYATQNPVPPPPPPPRRGRGGSPRRRRSSRRVLCAQVLPLPQVGPHRDHRRGLPACRGRCGPRHRPPRSLASERERNARVSLQGSLQTPAV